MLRFSAILVVLLCSCNVYGAAWVQKQGSGQLIVGTTTYQSSHYYNNYSDRTNSDINFRKLEFNPFIEYGYSDNITIGASPVFQQLHFDKNNIDDLISDTRQCNSRISSPSYNVDLYIFESEFFLRRKLFERNNFVLSLQPLLKTPCVIAYDNNTYITDKTFDGELRLLAGYGFKWEENKRPDGIKLPFAGQYHFLNLEAAYRKRGDIFADQIRVDGTAGFRLNSDILLMGQLFSTISAEHEPSGTILYNTMAEDRYYSLKAQASVVNQLNDKASLQLGVFKDVAGQNSGSGIGAVISLWYGF